MAVQDSAHQTLARTFAGAQPGLNAVVCLGQFVESRTRYVFVVVRSAQATSVSHVLVPLVEKLDQRPW